MGFCRGGAAVVGLLLLACAAGVQAAAYRVDVKGLEGNLAQNVDVQVKTLLAGSVPEERQAFRAQLHRAIRTGLRALGHYRPEIRYEWEKNAKGEETDLLHVTVDPGEPVVVSETSVTFRGGAADDRAFERLKRRLPKKGTVLNHGEYEDFKSRIEAVAVRKGYFDGGFKRKVLGVDAEKREAYWWLEYDSGERYRFGKTTFKGSQIDDDILQNLVPYKEGAYYNSNRVAELNSRLSETGWFNSVVVVPQMEEGRESKVLPMAGNLTPKSANSVEVGAGFSTDVGPTFKTTWRKPWLNSRGHSLTGVLDLSSKEQELGFGYKLPLAENALEQYWLFQGGYKHEDLNDTKSDSTMLSASRNWDYEDGWQRTVNLRWSLDKFTQADVTNTTMLITPGVSISRTRTKGGMMPTWGDSQPRRLERMVGVRRRLRRPAGAGRDDPHLRQKAPLCAAFALRVDRNESVRPGPAGPALLCGGRSERARLRLQVDLSRKRRGRTYGRLAPGGGKHRIPIQRDGEVVGRRLRRRGRSRERLQQPRLQDRGGRGRALGLAARPHQIRHRPPGE